MWYLVVGCACFALAGGLVLQSYREAQFARWKKSKGMQ